MKRLWVFILIAVFGLVGWALPAGAEKVRLSDAQLDEITAGGCLICVPPPNSLNGIANAFINASGMPSPPWGMFDLGGGTPKGRGNNVTITGEGGVMPLTGSFRICGIAFGQPFSLGGNCNP
jgi:hypothetical protein